MRRTALFVTLAFLTGLGVGLLLGGADLHSFPQSDTRAADLTAIEELHRADIAATLAQDPVLLVNLWTDDGVRLGGPGPAVVGKRALREMYEKVRAAYPGFQVLKYAPEIKDMQIADGWAIEWGYSEATFKMSAEAAPVTLRVKGLRVLRRQSDGSWKFARVAEVN